MKANLITFTILFISLFPAISKGTHSSQSLPTADTDCTPAITIDVVPEMGSFDNLEGAVSCADPATHHVAVYIFTANGWWSKPTFANPLTLIQPDGSWNANYTTGGTDHLATMLIAFLVPDSYTPPLMGGGSTLPAELFANTLANDRVLRFSDFRWTVKQFDTPVGPGPNLFSGLPEDVWIDGNGRLHLTISQHNGQWFSTEVFTRETLGYGTYVFYTTGQLDQLDENIILGLFTWDNNAPANYYREIDIEIAKWGNPANPNNAQFVVQPWDTPGNLHGFHIAPTTNQLTHAFSWDRERVTFTISTSHQYPPDPNDILATWAYAQPDNIPPTGPANARINLWLYWGSPPANGEPEEVIIDGFQFLPHNSLFLPFVAYEN